MEIDGKHVVVTGGGSGLGAATARRLAAEGATLSVFDLSTEKAEAVAAEIGGKAYTVDVADPAASTAINAAAEASGPIRGLVNCAGVAAAARIVGREGPMPLNAFENVIRVNLLGTFNMLRLAANQMSGLEPLPGGERGAIVNTASVAAFDGQLGQTAYAAAKGGVVSLALPAARELARFGIRVNTIAPGVFMTPMLQELPQETLDGIAASIPFPQRLGDPAEYAEAALFCLKSGYLNAEVIRLDGAVRLPPR